MKYVLGGCGCFGLKVKIICWKPLSSARQWAHVLHKCILNAVCKLSKLFS